MNFYYSHKQHSLDCGTTASIILIVGDHLFCANLGDSRAIISSKGEAISLSIDHKPSSPYELKRIQEAGGQV